jgi:hypothetical protein
MSSKPNASNPTHSCTAELPDKMIYQSRMMMRPADRRNVPTRHQMPTIIRIIAESSICVLGLLSSIRIHFVGDLFVTELILITCLPFFLLLRGRRLLKPKIIQLLALLGVWFLSQVLTDAYRSVAIDNRLRGMANVGFFVAEIACFAMLLTSNRRRAIFLVFYAIGSIVMARLQPFAAALKEERGVQWKWGYSPGCILLAVLISCYLIAHRKEAFALFVLLGINSINLLYNYRSAFLELLVTTVLVVPIIPERIGRLRLLPQKNNLLRVAIVAALALVGGWSANQGVHLATQSGLLSEEARRKNETEAEAGNLLFGGRPEFFIGLRAAMDSPFLGHGSWASDIKYAEMMADMNHVSGGAAMEIEREAGGVIPTHSHIIGAWVFAGILGTLFWAYLFWLVLRAIAVVAIRRPPLAPAYAWLLVSYCWAILFSPFGSTSRIIESFTIVIIVDLLEAKATHGTTPSLLRGHWRRSGSVRLSMTPLVPNPGRSRPWRVR